ncbi:MAG TPA: PilZ domain-containing protein [Allosphingosinicella sp.]
MKLGTNQTAMRAAHWPAAARTPASSVNRRRAARTPLSLLARMQTLHGTRTVRLCDVSSCGSKVEGAPPDVKPGSEAILKCHELDVFATVHWARGDTCGIRFNAPVHDAVIRALELMSEQLRLQPEDVASS